MRSRTPGARGALVDVDVPFPHMMDLNTDSRSRTAAAGGYGLLAGAAAPVKEKSLGNVSWRRHCGHEYE